MSAIDEAAILRYAHLESDALAMNTAALAGDFDEARFRAHLVNAAAMGLALHDVADAAFDIELLLGPPDTDPFEGYGSAMLRLARLLAPPAQI